MIKLNSKKTERFSFCFLFSGCLFSIFFWYPFLKNYAIEAYKIEIAPSLMLIYLMPITMTLVLGFSLLIFSSYLADKETAIELAKIKENTLNEQIRIDAELAIKLEKIKLEGDAIQKDFNDKIAASKREHDEIIEEIRIKESERKLHRDYENLKLKLQNINKSNEDKKTKKHSNRYLSSIKIKYVDDNDELIF